MTKVTCPKFDRKANSARINALVEVGNIEGLEALYAEVENELDTLGKAGATGNQLRTRWMVRGDIGWIISQMRKGD